LIRAEYKTFYGRDWRRLRARLIELRGAACSKCKRPGARYLNLAHTAHDPRTSSVKLLCAACHARHDAPHRVAIARRRRARAAGQLWLWAEIEHASTPAWRIPAGALGALQWELFA
jgi:hypothetical protein